MRLGRGAALRAAILLAVGFVALRVIYRAVFGGAGGSGTVLLDLPPVRLAGPFTHVVLFGEVTTGGLAAAVVSALPFAALVLAVGVLAASVDLFALAVPCAVRSARSLAHSWSPGRRFRPSCARCAG
jgi:energy-coupling factor transport system ATP-binding protein